MTPEKTSRRPTLCYIPLTANPYPSPATISAHPEFSHPSISIDDLPQTPRRSDHIPASSHAPRLSGSPGKGNPPCHHAYSLGRTFPSATSRSAPFPSMPICPHVCCSSITSMFTLIPSTVEKNLHVITPFFFLLVINTFRPCSPLRPAGFLPL